jgi:hypothetical protein
MLEVPRLLKVAWLNLALSMVYMFEGINEGANIRENN